MNQTLNEMIEEQFATGPVPEKMWLVVTDDRFNKANVRERNGRFHPAILLEGIHSETKAGAAATCRRCFHTTVYGVVETVEEAMELMKYGTMVLYTGEIIRRNEADYE